MISLVSNVFYCTLYVNITHFVGGLGTGSITLAWAMAELVKNPKLMKKAQEEIRNYVRNKLKVAEDDIEQFPYLKMIVKETLKLHPLAPLLIPREIISHLKIEGYDFYQKNNGSSERLGNWTRPHILERSRGVPSREI